jgi:hypothetical protein
MVRRSLSFMLTGLLIAVPILLTAYAARLRSVRLRRGLGH